MLSVRGGDDDGPMSQGTSLRLIRSTYVVPTLAGALAMVIATWLPGVSALLVALVLGAALVNVAPGVVRAHQLTGAKNLLRLGIVVLGLQLSLAEVARVGGRGLVIVVATVFVTFGVTVWLGRRLQLGRKIVVLVAAGFAVCGAAAVAAVSEVVRPKEKEVAEAIALVTLWGSAMMFLVPWLGGLLGLREAELGVWIGASIHEVAQVAGAASMVGGAAAVSAMLIKLGRVVLLGPITWLAGVGASSSGSARRGIPWFLWGFLGAILVRSLVPLPESVLGGSGMVSTLLLAGGMFGLGLGLRLSTLWPISRPLLLLSSASTTVALLVPLGLILLLF